MLPSVSLLSSDCLSIHPSIHPSIIISSHSINQSINQSNQLDSQPARLMLLPLLLLLLLLLLKPLLLPQCIKLSGTSLTRKYSLPGVCRCSPRGTRLNKDEPHSRWSNISAETMYYVFFIHAATVFFQSNASKLDKKFYVTGDKRSISGCISK